MQAFRSDQKHYMSKDSQVGQGWVLKVVQPKIVENLAPRPRKAPEKSPHALRLLKFFDGCQILLLGSLDAYHKGI